MAATPHAAGSSPSPTFCSSRRYLRSSLNSLTSRSRPIAQGSRVPSCQLPPRLACKDSQVFGAKAARLLPGRNVSPENPLFVPRLLLQKTPSHSAVGGADAVQDARGRLVHDPVAGALEAEGQVNVFEIAAEGFRKETNPLETGPAKKAARCAGAEDGTGPGEGGTRARAVPALGCHAAEVVAIAGAIDPAAIGPGQDQRRHGCRWPGP